MSLNVVRMFTSIVNLNKLRLFSKEKNPTTRTIATKCNINVNPKNLLEKNINNMVGSIYL